MALERQSIERKDFPIARRGYEPETVDAHLRSLAEEVEALKRSAGPRTETLASTASEQVRTIVEAAESSAAEIRQQAEDEAREARAAARAEAQDTREQATSQAREYVASVSQSTATMMQRLEAMESELGTLIESLRSGSGRVAADLQLLMSNLDELRASVVPGSAVAPESLIEPEPERLAGEPRTAEPEGLEMEEQAVPAPAEELAPAVGEGPENGADDTEGARLIALNMALNGTPRDETDRYLAENFTLANRSRLLDEVYASVEG